MRGVTRAKEMLQPGDVLRKRSKKTGAVAEARVTDRGIEFEGQVYEAISNAAKAVAAKLGMASTSINGWAFFEIVRSTPSDAAAPQDDAAAPQTAAPQDATAVPSIGEQVAEVLRAKKRAPRGERAAQKSEEALLRAPRPNTLTEDVEHAERAQLMLDTFPDLARQLAVKRTRGFEDLSVQKQAEALGFAVGDTVEHVDGRRGCIDSFSHCGSLYFCMRITGEVAKPLWVPSNVRKVSTALGTLTGDV